MGRQISRNPPATLGRHSIINKNIAVSWINKHPLFYRRQIVLYAYPFAKLRRVFFLVFYHIFGLAVFGVEIALATVALALAFFAIFRTPTMCDLDFFFGYSLAGFCEPYTLLKLGEVSRFFCNVVAIAFNHFSFLLCVMNRVIVLALILGVAVAHAMVIHPLEHKAAVVRLVLVVPIVAPLGIGLYAEIHIVEIETVFPKLVVGKPRQPFQVLGV